MVQLLAWTAVGVLQKHGVRMDKLRWHQHGPDELAHYAKDAYDIEYEFPMGFKELEGVHNRTNFDLTRHTEYSGKDMQYIDQDNGNERYIPYIIETSAGLTRNLLMFLCDAYEEQKLPIKATMMIGEPCYIFIRLLRRLP